MNSTNNSGINTTIGKSNQNHYGLSNLFTGSDKMTASYLILIGSIINFFINMKQRKIDTPYILIHLTIIVMISYGISII